MLFKLSLISLLVISQLPFGSLTYGHDSAIGEAAAYEKLYEGIVASFAALPVDPAETRDVAYLKYGNEKIAFRQSAFSSLIQHVIFAKAKVLEEACPHCHHDDKEELAWAARLKKLTTLKTIQILGFVYKGLRQYGIGYAIFFVIFEATEHTVFAYLPPMCPVYHAMYFKVSDFARKLKIYLRRDLPLATTEKTRVVFKTALLDIVFWNKLRTLAYDNTSAAIRRGDYKSFAKNRQEFESTSLKPASDPVETVLAKSDFWGEGWQAFLEGERSPSLTLEDDIAFIFSQAPPAERYWVATRQVQGFNLMLDFLSGIASERYEDGSMTGKQLFATYNILGRMGRHLNNYREDLAAYSFTSSEKDLTSARDKMLSEVALLKTFFIEAQELIDDSGPSLDQNLTHLLERAKSPFHNCLTTLQTI